MKATITIRDEVNCLITGMLPQHSDALYHKFGIFKDGYFFNPAYKLRRWDGKVHFVEKTGASYVRLLDKIIPLIVDFGYDIELDDTRAPLKPPAVPGQILEIDSSGIAVKATGLDVFSNKAIQLRPYQLQAVQEVIKAGSGIIIGGTGAGKSLICAAIAKCYSGDEYRVMTIVPSADLVIQTHEWYQLCGLDVGKYSGDDKDIYHENVVATWQAIQNSPGILADFNVIIWDETHGAKADVAQKLLNSHAQHIAFRFGVTGTMPKPESDRMAIFCTLGPILLTISPRWLIDNGFLANPRIQPVEVNETFVDEEFPNYESEKMFLSKNPARMGRIADQIIDYATTYGNTLVLVNSVPFGKKLAKLIDGAVFLSGESKTDLRKEHYDMFDQRNDLIVIATSGIASTGISIDRIFCLILIDAGKSYIRSIQSIGRSLRKGVDKTEVFVADISSKLKWARKHAKERLKWYKEMGYEVASKKVLTV